MFSALLRRLYNAIIGSDSVRYASYPALATGATVTGNAAANTKGAWAQLIAAAAVTEDFWVVGVQATLNMVDEYMIDIGFGAAGAEAALITDLPVEMNTRAVTAAGETDRIHAAACLPYPIKVAANTRIAARLATVGGGSDTADVKVIVATGL